MNFYPPLGLHVYSELWRPYSTRVLNQATVAGPAHIQRREAHRQGRADTALEHFRSRSLPQPILLGCLASAHVISVDGWLLSQLDDMQRPPMLHPTRTRIRQ
jgi:hypothetical protein